MEKVFEHFTITILKLNKLVQRIKQFESNKYGLKSIHIMCGYYLNEHPDGLTAGERDFFYTALGSIADNLEQYYKNLLGDTEE